MAKILKPTPENIALCAAALKKGEVVAMPTETVYGLAGNASDANALARIFRTKERPTFDPLIAHVALEKSSLAELMKGSLIDSHRLSNEAVRRTDKLIRAFWPGPLTLVLPKTDLVPDLATSGLDTVAIREPKHPVARALIQEFKLPVCAPSANRFGRISPTSAQDVDAELGDRIPYILDGGPCEVGLESTILQVKDDGTLILLRPGVIGIQEIANAIGVAPLDARASGAFDQTDAGAAKRAPGMLASHYAPTTPLTLLPTPISQMMSAPKLAVKLPKKIALLTISGDPKKAAAAAHEILNVEIVAAETLSRTGDWIEAGRNLFKTLRTLDTSGAEMILSEPCLEETGIGYAIADRLRRAAQG